MEEKNDFALVPKPPGALEKAVPGAKRVLSGMVADTLALAKKETPRESRPLRIVMVNDEPDVLASFEIVIRGWFKAATIISFNNGAEALEELCETEPDLLITDDKMARMNGEELCRRLLDKQVTYSIIVDSPWAPTEAWVRELAIRGLNVSFLPLPLEIATLRKLLEHAGLTIPRDATDSSKITTQPRNTLPLKIIMVCSEPGPFKSLEILVRFWFKDAAIQLFQDSGEAVWQELSRTDPDLLITADAMPVLRGSEIVRRLLDRKATYPIIVTSAYDPTEEWVREYASRGLNVRFLAMPWTIEDIREILQAALNFPLNEYHE